ncbi:MAG: DNA-binding protein [Candidatus Latescibacteria bacterium]|nr:DNA-binding protein [Candidatus Latescibacterota bacterium]
MKCPVTVDLLKDELLTAAEVAALTKSPIGTIRVFTSRGRIPRAAIVRIGRKVLYTRSGIERWLAQEQVAA